MSRQQQSIFSQLLISLQKSINYFTESTKQLNNHQSLTFLKKNQKYQASDIINIILVMIVISMFLVEGIRVFIIVICYITPLFVLIVKLASSYQENTQKQNKEINNNKLNTKLTKQQICKVFIIYLMINILIQLLFPLFESLLYFICLQFTSLIDTVISIITQHNYLQIIYIPFKLIWNLIIVIIKNITLQDKIKSQAINTKWIKFTCILLRVLFSLVFLFKFDKNINKINKIWNKIMRTSKQQNQQMNINHKNKQE